MEDQVERFDADTIPKVPLKTEEISQGSPDNDASERSNGAASPPPNCSICLGRLINKSFTDSCLHQFCFSCLLQWSKIKTECPLCKQTFKSIIHNVRSEEDYDQYHVPRQFVPPIPPAQMAATLDVNLDLVGVNLDVGGRRFSYRTTMTPHRRYGVLLNPDQVARREQVPVVTSLVSRDERRHRRTNPVDYRRNVYRCGTPATSLPDIFGRFRECSAEYYRREPGQLDRLIPFLNRELQVLLNNNAPHITYVMRRIIDSLSRYDMRSPEFRDVVRPYLGIHADHFVHELLNYARTSFDLIGYDQYVTYAPNHGSIGLMNDYNTHVLSPSSSSSSSNDSDVQVVDETIDVGRLNAQMPGVGPHTVEMPGPSNVGEALHSNNHASTLVLTISSSSSGPSDNECEVVGFVKPRHERTPEIIDLSSSDIDEVVNTTAAVTDVRDQSRSNYQPVASIQYTVYDETFDQGSSDELFQPSTSTDKRRNSTQQSRRLLLKTASSNTASSDSDFDSDREYTSQRISKLNSKSEKSTRITIRYRKNKRKNTLARNRRHSRVIASSSSESEPNTRRRTRTRKLSALPPDSERKYSSSWSDSSPDWRISRSKTKEQSKLVQSEVTTIKVRQDLIKTDERVKDEYATSEASQWGSSVSDHQSYEDKKYESKHANKSVDSRKELRNYESDENSGSGLNGTEVNKQSNAKFNLEYSSSESEKTLTIVRSSKSHACRKKSKHKDKRKDKDSRRSNSKSVPSACDSFQTNDCVPSVSSAPTSSSIRDESTSISKYSSSKKRPHSKDKHKSRKKHKESKKSHKRSKNESKSRTKKKKRRIRSSSSSSSNSVSE